MFRPRPLILWTIFLASRFREQDDRCNLGPHDFVLGGQVNNVRHRRRRLRSNLQARCCAQREAQVEAIKW